MAQELEVGDKVLYLCHVPCKIRSFGRVVAVDGINATVRVEGGGLRTGQLGANLIRAEVRPVNLHPDQCQVQRNGYPCSRPAHDDNCHDYPIGAYGSADDLLRSLFS